MLSPSRRPSRRPGWTAADSAELRQSLLIAWLIVSCVLTGAVILPLVASDSSIDAIAPRCVWKTSFGRECPACGLTTAFVRIARGDWAGAWKANRAGIPLYVAFTINALVWIRFLLIRARGRRLRSCQF